jgi:hypothetical protein
MRQQTGADEFIEGVVAADVFSDGEQCQLFIEESRGVEAAGGGEMALGLAEAFREGIEGLGRQGEGAERGKLVEEAGDGAAATNATTGGDGEAARGYLGGGGKLEVEFLAGGVAGGGEAEDLRGVGEDAFGEEEAGGQGGVIAGAAHEGGEGFAVDPDLEGFFDGEGVLRFV